MSKYKKLLIKHKDELLKAIKLFEKRIKAINERLNLLQ